MRPELDRTRVSPSAIPDGAGDGPAASAPRQPEELRETATSAPRRTPALTFSEDQLAVQRLTRLGMVVWPAFFLLDMYMVFAVYPQAPLWRFFVYRVIGEVLIITLWFVCNSPRTSASVLRVVNAVMSAACSTLISFMALEIGGMNSAYLHGISTVIMIQSIMVPAPWRRILWFATPCALTFPIVTGLATLKSPAALGSNLQEIASFFANYTFVLGTVVVGAAAGHVVWAARLQVYQSRRLGRYRLEARIGEGGMNEVWLAWDVSLRRKVALKILRVLETTSLRAVARFEREAQAMSQLSSPNTVRVFDFGASDDGVYYIAMEYLNGMDLAKLVRSIGPLPPERVVYFATQACRSLAEAHAAGVIHRDIKPANLFVTRVGDEYDVVKLLDFGIAQLGTPNTQSIHLRTIAGTPAFMSPEAWLSGHIDERSDIYSLGATLYFLLTGVTPFDHVEGRHLVSAHFGSPPRAPSALLNRPVPAALEEVVLRCLAKAPAQRYASARELSEALASCIHTSWTAEQAKAAWHIQLSPASMGAAGLNQATQTVATRTEPARTFVR